jgi:ABC-type bacteriocin/lantibiotic exporter with double-glycine peptidase domain
MDEEVSAMPDGPDTFVGSGGIRLSGGQQARIALARTLLNKNKIIILDDPFSAVDMATEMTIIKNMKASCSDSLIIIISHRLSIFNEVNQIILLQGQHDALYGTHDELMRSSDLYAKIYSLQYPEGGESYEA